MSTYFKRILIFLVAVLLLLPVLSGCSGASKITLVLDWTPNTNHTGFYVAKDLGYFKEEGLDVDIVQPPEDGALSLVAAGRADFGISFQEEVIVAANAKSSLPVTAIASLIEHNTCGIFSLKEKNITRFKDLEGKKYGSWQVPIYDEIIKECIRNDGGDPSKVEFVPNSAVDSITGLKRDFDAAWVFEGWDKIIADVTGVETNFLSFKDANPVFNYYTPVLVTNSKNIDANTTKKFLRAVAKGYEYAKNNPKEAAEILSKYAPEVDKDIIYASQEFLSKNYYSEKWGYIDEERWNTFFNWMKEKELVDSGASNAAFKNVEY